MIDNHDIDDTAAEYVLGTLSREERAEVDALRPSAAKLDAAITDWEKRLAPLNEATPDAVPSVDLLPKIQQRISTQSMAAVMPNPATLNREVFYWRSLALAASVAFIIVSGVMLHGMIPSQTAPQLLAVLQKDSAVPAFLVSLNETTSTMTVRTLAATPPADKSYELWIIAEGTGAPRSLGVMPTQDAKLVSLAGIDPAVIRGATLAVSIEPPGGSPTGAPTGPVVFTGKFVQTPL